MPTTFCSGCTTVLKVTPGTGSIYGRCDECKAAAAAEKAAAEKSKPLDKQLAEVELPGKEVLDGQE